jgi:WD40 repeat protein
MNKKQVLRGLPLTILFSLWLISTSYAMQNQQPELPIFARPSLTVLDLEYSPSGLYLAQVYSEGRLEVLDVASGRIAVENDLILPNALFRAKLAWSSKGDVLAVGIGPNVYFWDVTSAKLLETLFVGGDNPLVYREADYYVPEGVASLQWDSTDRLLMAQSESSRYTVWSVEQQEFIFDLTDGYDAPPMVWLADNRRFSTGHRYLDTQNIAKGFVVPRTKDIAGGDCANYASISNNADRTMIAWGTFNGCVIILDADTGNQIALYKIADNETTVWDIDWSPDDSAVVAVDSMGAVQVVELATGKVTLIAQNEGSLYAVDWANTNAAIAYGGVTEDEASIFDTVSVADVERLMASDAARSAEFAVTLSESRE